MVCDYAQHRDSRSQKKRIDVMARDWCVRANCCADDKPLNVPHGFHDIKWMLVIDAVQRAVLPVMTTRRACADADCREDTV